MLKSSNSFNDFKQEKIELSAVKYWIAERNDIKKSMVAFIVETASISFQQKKKNESHEKVSKNIKIILFLKCQKKIQ